MTIPSAFVILLHAHDATVLHRDIPLKIRKDACYILSAAMLEVVRLQGSRLKI